MVFKRNHYFKRKAFLACFIPQQNNNTRYCIFPFIQYFNSELAIPGLLGVRNRIPTNFTIMNNAYIPSMLDEKMSIHKTIYLYYNLI